MSWLPDIKFCGLVEPGDAQEAVALGVKAIGLVFYPQSPRYVNIREALAIRQVVPSYVSLVGLFVNAPREQIASIQSEIGLDVLQFHGDEGPENLRHWNVPVWRAVRMRSPIDLPAAREQFPMASCFVLDAHVDTYGGAGKSFDWKLAMSSNADGKASASSSMQSQTPIMLSGGLNASNVASGIRQLSPAWVDVSSGIQTEDPRKKDSEKMRAFVDAVQNWRAG